jgi:hypothetical protein
MERMIRLDERDPDMIRKAIVWAHEGPGSVGNGNGWGGWGAVVQCPGKLRKQFDKMARQARAARQQGSDGDELRALAADLRAAGM